MMRMGKLSTEVDASSTSFEKKTGGATDLEIPYLDRLQDGNVPQLGDFAKVFEYLKTSPWSAYRQWQSQRDIAGEDAWLSRKYDDGGNVERRQVELGLELPSKQVPTSSARMSRTGQESFRQLASLGTIASEKDAKDPHQPSLRSRASVLAISAMTQAPPPGPIFAMLVTPPSTPRPSSTSGSLKTKTHLVYASAVDVDIKSRARVIADNAHAGTAIFFYKTPVSGVIEPLAFPVVQREKQQQAMYDKLRQRFHIDKLVHKLHPQAASTIHVFVDMSNIIIGFYKTLASVHGLPKDSRFAPAPDFNFEHLAQAMERGRHVAKAVAVGSMHPGHTRRPNYFEQAEAGGYIVDVRKRIPRDFYGATDDSPSSDSGRASGSGNCGRMREDRIDEAIHLQMSESILDAPHPGTIVLATGDAARAEVSGGFLCFAERALKRGWIVEVVSWKTSLSSAWLDRDWRDKWGESFTVLELDPIVKELVVI